MLPVTYQGVIDEEYLDANGHMNVSWYLHLFSRASGGMYRELGFDWRKLREGGTSSFALEAHVRYFAELMMDEKVCLRTRLVSYTPKRVHWIHFMWNETRPALAATQEEVLAHVDMSERRMTVYPESILTNIQRTQAIHCLLAWEPPICGVMQA